MHPQECWTLGFQKVPSNQSFNDPWGKLNVGIKINRESEVSCSYPNRGFNSIAPPANLHQLPHPFQSDKRICCIKKELQSYRW
jgi:hypothetical protein